MSLRNRALIALVTLSVLLFGGLSMTSLKQELIPSVSLPIVSVVTSYPGASPEIVDEDVSRLVETSLQGLQGLSSTQVTSSANLSSVTVEFEYGTDTVYAEQRIQQALNRIESQLPEGTETTVLSGSIDDFPVIQIAATGGTNTEELAASLESSTVPGLTELDGVREAAVSGAPVSRIEITPDQAALAGAGASIQSIRDTLDAAGTLIPIGQITEGEDALTVQAGTLLDNVDAIAALPLSGATPATTTLGDVATLELGPEPASSISRVNGEDALTVSVTKLANANTVEVSQAVRDALPALQASIGGGATLQIVFDQAPFIQQSIDTLVVEGLLGLVFAVIVIFVFLLSFRATLVTAISIPTSLLVTFIGLQAAEYSLNILTLGALTIAIGRVVDDSIVVIENIKRHMAMHPGASLRGSERVRVISEAVREVATAVTSATIATVAVYLPIAFVGDISGELFRPFALTSVIALLASLLVSLTIVPVLAYWMLGGRHLKRPARVGTAETWSGNANGDANGNGTEPGDASTRPEPSREREHVLASETAPATGGVAMQDSTTATETEAAGSDSTVEAVRVRPRRERAQRDAGRFAPLGLRSDDEELHPRRARRRQAEQEAGVAGRAEHGPDSELATTHEESSWLQRGYEPVLGWTLRRPFITLGAAVLILILTGALAPLMKTNFLGNTGSNSFTVTQALEPNLTLAASGEAASQVEDILRAKPGVETVQLTIGGGGAASLFTGGGASRASFSVTTSTDADADAIQAELREELDALPEEAGEISVGGGGSAGFSSAISVDLTAPDAETLREASDQVVATLSGVEELGEITSDLDETRPFVQMDIDQATAAQYGLSQTAIGGIVAQQLQPTPVGSLTVDGSSVQVVLLGAEPPANIDALRATSIPTALGPVPLTTLATVEIVDGPVSISSERGVPLASVTVVPTDDNLSSANALITEQLDSLTLPEGATAVLGGVSSDQAAAFQQLGLALLAAILIVYIVMVATFKSLLQPLLLLVSVPFAATGAILLQLASGVPLGVASLIGVLMLIGVVVTNAIVLIDLVNQFRERGLAVRDAILAGGARRVRPIVMTALATMLALTPMALGITGHGGFISQPLALVVIGGLLSSTVLTLLVLPALYTVVEGPLERRRARRDARIDEELAANDVD
ncbi:efflux RND transporter permease subunit [Pseudoclavibacter terrae]|uniref:Efflux RND transporter permease subunit n=1 Tax=Pseudoclavibacter terrae TaxID=1530195 RepID=A0A7J5B4B9_9MICO|nr:efflux RND transporter permease subunit [Pseudoclavibacter terrae]KAB1639023.1 efflux RND transporter permease subunit [Pseudoclavibacter terrae]